jgi:hypothetical protein
MNYLLHAGGLKLFTKICLVNDCLLLQRNLNKIFDWYELNKCLQVQCYDIPN